MGDPSRAIEAVEADATHAATLGPRCRYHSATLMVLTPAAQPLFNLSARNPLSTERLRREAAKRKIWRCPVAGCPWVEAVDYTGGDDDDGPWSSSAVESE
jgi:hypothetical protein